MSSRSEKIETFQNTTNAGIKTATSYLARFGWDLRRAVDSYFEHGDEDSSSISSSPCQPVVSLDAINAWFDTYADPDDPDTMEEEGILKFCEDIAVDPQDVLILIISWKMNAATMCTFTRAEWCKGMQALGCESVDAMKQKLPNIRGLVTSDAEFKSLYSFCFGFSKELGQKSLSLDIAVPMWELLLLPRFPKVSQWLIFLKAAPCRGITRDTWDLFFDFMTKVKESYEDYDESEAWPVLIDDFMVWRAEQK